MFRGEKIVKCLGLIVCFVLIVNKAKSQTIDTNNIKIDTTNISVEKKFISFQVGIINLNLNSEFKISNKVSLRLGGTIYYNPFNVSQKYNPNIEYYFSIEPKYFYNLKKRAKKGRNIQFNAGNFLYGSANYYVGRPITQKHNVERPDVYDLLIGYGLRRNITQHVNFEFGIGVGVLYQHYQNPNVSEDRENKFGFANTAILRLGYSFRTKKVN